MASSKLTRRGYRILGILVVSSIALFFYIRRYGSLLFGPPLYETVRARENALPHYEEYKRKTVKYFLDANPSHGSGWGNVMQDFVMMSLLAHSTNRSFVFNDYAWNPNGPLYSEYNGRRIPSRIPLSAIVGGPMVGGPWPDDDQTPRSVSREFFHEVCPNPTILQTSDINTEEMRYSDDIPASYMFEKWVKKINSIEDPCLMLDPSSEKIFNFRIYGNKKRLLSIWPHLSKSPVSTHWEWSPLIHDAFTRNRHLLKPKKTGLFGGFFRQEEDSHQEDATLAVPGLLAIHVRRGDFEDHCSHLAKWSADWNAFNSFPEFLDKFERPTDSGWGRASNETIALYLRRCYPTIEQIVEKVGQVQREAAEPLRYLFIMTNGPSPWVRELESALARSMSWDRISSSRDLKLSREQKFVAQAVDMYVAQQAQVFIGNGWSSLTSNVVMLRMARGFEPNTNRFW